MIFLLTKLTGLLYIYIVLNIRLFNNTNFISIGFEMPNSLFRKAITESHGFSLEKGRIAEKPNGFEQSGFFCTFVSG